MFPDAQENPFMMVNFPMSALLDSWFSLVWGGPSMDAADWSSEIDILQIAVVHTLSESLSNMAGLLEGRGHKNRVKLPKVGT